MLDPIPCYNSHTAAMLTHQTLIWNLHPPAEHKPQRKVLSAIAECSSCSPFAMTVFHIPSITKKPLACQLLSVIVSDLTRCGHMPNTGFYGPSHPTPPLLKTNGVFPLASIGSGLGLRSPFLVDQWLIAWCDIANVGLVWFQMTAVNSFFLVTRIGSELSNQACVACTSPCLL